MIPFDLTRFDKKDLNENQTIMKRLLNLCVPYLFVCDKSQDAAAYLLAKFMSRVDVNRSILNDFYNSLLQFVSEAKSILFQTDHLIN